MSRCRKNSVRDKVIGKEVDLFREKYTPQSVPLRYGVVSFYELGNFTG